MSSSTRWGDRDVASMIGELREGAELCRRGSLNTLWGRILARAADLIDHQRGEVERLRARIGTATRDAYWPAVLKAAERASLEARAALTDREAEIERLQGEVERLRSQLIAERAQHALIARNRGKDAEDCVERQACEDIAYCIERSCPALRGEGS